MYLKSIKGIAALGLFVASVSASATPLNEYNLILSGDFKVSGGSGHIEGKAFIGGDMVKGSVFAQHVNKRLAQPTFVMVMAWVKAVA
jgi:hypothetical protein